MAYIVFLIPISWQPNFEDLRYFKLWILIDWLIVVNHHQVANTMWIRKSELVTKAWSLISKDCIITRKTKDKQQFLLFTIFWFEKNKKMEKKFHFFAYNTSMSVHKKSQPNRSSRLAGNTQHRYECLVLIYMIILYMRARVRA